MDIMMLVVVVIMERVTEATEMMLKSMMGSAPGSVPRRCFALKQIDEMMYRDMTAVTSQKFPWVLAAEPMA